MKRVLLACALCALLACTALTVRAYAHGVDRAFSQGYAAALCDSGDRYSCGYGDGAR